METEKFYTLPSASQRTREADGIIRSKSRGLRVSDANCGSPGLRVKGKNQECQCWSAGDGEWLFLWCFILIGPQKTGWCPPTLWGRSLLSLQVQMWVSSGNNLTDTPEISLVPALWASLNPVKWTRNINHYNHLPFICCTNSPWIFKPQIKWTPL